MNNITSHCYIHGLYHACAFTPLGPDPKPSPTFGTDNQMVWDKDMRTYLPTRGDVPGPDALPAGSRVVR
jgi:hypothetical protein